MVERYSMVGGIAARRIPLLFGPCVVAAEWVGDWVLAGFIVVVAVLRFSTRMGLTEQFLAERPVSARRLARRFAAAFAALGLLAVLALVAWA